jgi:hypothetical protein
MNLFSRLGAAVTKERLITIPSPSDSQFFSAFTLFFSLESGSFSAANETYERMLPLLGTPGCATTFSGAWCHVIPCLGLSWLPPTPLV